MARQAREIFKELQEITQKLFNDSSVKSCEGKIALCGLRHLGQDDVNQS